MDILNKTYICRSFKPNKWAIKGKYLKHLQNEKHNLIVEDDKYYRVIFKNSDAYKSYLISTGDPATDYLRLIEKPGSYTRLKHNHGEIIFEYTFRDNAEAYYAPGANWRE